MVRSRFIHHRVPVGVVSFLALCSASGQAASRAELLERPPFHTAKPAVAAGAQGLEYTGYFGSGDSTEFSLREPGEPARWVRLRDPAAHHYIESVSDDGDAIIVVTAGIRTRIGLRREARATSGFSTWTMPAPSGGVVTVSSAEAPVVGTYVVDAETGSPFVHRNKDGTVWFEPKEGQGLHPDDPGNAD